MDYRLYHAVNSLRARALLARPSRLDGRDVAVPLFAVVTCALWLLDRPGGPRKWKLASASALASAALALLVARVIGEIWTRPRPFATHASAHVWGGRSHDASFPSDHASAAFAIAFAILLFDQTVGVIFVVAAAVVAAGRVVVGAHYPSDVLGGMLVAYGRRSSSYARGGRRSCASSASSKGSPTRSSRRSGGGCPPSGALAQEPREAPVLELLAARLARRAVSDRVLLECDTT